ncbi:MAG: HlyC/CorC family transporter [Alphaproteobacteria bacterium]|nr:HlyC/CorC family transporter [Alphaproteobacteria bacterium]
MTVEWLMIGGLIVALLVISAFFSGSETALTASSEPRMHELARQGSRRARLVLGLHDRKDRLIGAILLGNNLVNIFASALATSVLLNIFGEAGVVYATLGMTMLILIFAEVLPKTYALGHSDNAALMVAPVIKPIVSVLAPVTATINKIVDLTLLAFGKRATNEFLRAHREEELRGAINLHKGSDPEIRQEREMLRSILDLDDVEVYEVMTHRRNVEMIDLADSNATILKRVVNSAYTRLPLYQDEPDNIVGVLHAKALLRETHGDASRIAAAKIAEIAADPWFIPETTSLLDQLQAFRERREHFAVVVDEYGAFMGVVTLEDILEEIVGNIDDEHDIAMPGVRPQATGSFIVNGSVSIRDLNREFEWLLPDDEATTIAGLVLHEARMIPEPGQVFVFYGFRFEILRRQRNQITLLRVTPQPAEDGQPAP